MMKHVQLIIMILLLFTGMLSAQMTKNEVRKVLILEGMWNTENFETHVDKLYGKYLDRISFKTTDLMQGVGYSILSGISLGTYESHIFGYKNSDWLPGFLKSWYNDSPRIGSEPVYGIFNIQTIAHEVDYLSDRIAYEKWKRFYRGKWYWALLTHWVIKNTFATLIRDKFKHNDLFYSFRIDFVVSISK